MFGAVLGAALLGAVASPAPATAPVVDAVPFGLFAPDDMSWTLGASLPPDGHTVYFAKSEPNYAGLTIFVSHLGAAGWSPPEIAPFSGQYAEGDPAVTPDGSAVVFSSRRPPLGTQASAALYEAFVTGPRSGSVVPLPNSANALGSETSPSIARDGSIYFALNARGVRRIYRVPSASPQTQQASPIALPGDADGIADRDVTVDPAQRFIVFSSTRPGSLGSFDLYLSFHVGDRWCAPVALPAPINSPAAEIAPSLSRDATTLYFSSTRTDLVQPVAAPLDAAGFAASLARYQNGTLRLYRTDLGPVVKRLQGSAAC